MGAGRVLVVEDEFLIRMTLVEALSDAGFEVVEASSAEEALAAVSSFGPFALLLTDVQLAGRIDGIDLAREMRLNLPDLPVIFMTGRPDSVVTPYAGARDLTIAKPYALSDICDAARRLTGGTERVS
jgi:CheY-like chemotaxis protein